MNIYGNKTETCVGIQLDMTTIILGQNHHDVHECPGLFFLTVFQHAIKKNH
jgi:hypothetical protein